MLPLFTCIYDRYRWIINFYLYKTWNMSVNDSLPIGLDEFTKLTNISHWIYRLWTIPFAIFGVTGNIFALIIFIHWINRLSIYIYFSFLCIINILILSRVLPRSSAHFLQNILPARFNYASLVALVELYRNWYLVLIRIMR